MHPIEPLLKDFVVDNRFSTQNYRRHILSRLSCSSKRAAASLGVLELVCPKVETKPPPSTGPTGTTGERKKTEIETVDRINKLLSLGGLVLLAW